MLFVDWLHTKLESTIIAYGLLTKQIIDFILFFFPSPKKEEVQFYISKLLIFHDLQ